MSDPITAAMVGAGVGGGTSLLRGKSLGSSLRNAAIGGALGGAGSYLGGAMGGAKNAVTPVIPPTTVPTSAIENISMFTPTGSFGTQTMNPALTGREFIGGLSGEQAIAQSMIPQASPNPFAGGYVGEQTVLGGGGYDTSLLGGLKRGVSGIMPGDVIMSNPIGYGNLALNAYDRMNQSQAPLQPSPMQSAQQLISQQGPVPTPQFNSLLQTSRRPILIG